MNPVTMIVLVSVTVSPLNVRPIAKFDTIDHCNEAATVINNTLAHAFKSAKGEEQRMICLGGVADVSGDKPDSP